MLAMDVDGTLTDGMIYVTDNGEFMKAFHVRDGYGLKHLLPSAGIIPAIITGRVSQIVAQRAQDLDITEVHQGVQDKLHVLDMLREKYNLYWEEIAYIGDDVNDLSSIQAVGLSFAPSDCADELKPYVDVILTKKGGAAVVRECIDYIIAQNKGISN